MADEEKQVPENDDWLNDFNESTDDIESADEGQTDFDELFESFEAVDQGATSEPTPSTENAAVSGGEIVEEEEELDQASIDALLGDTGDGSDTAPEEAVDQASIDALLGDTDAGSDPTPEAAAPAEPAADENLDQSALDELLGDTGGGEDALSEVPEGSTDDYISDSLGESAELNESVEPAGNSLEAEAVDFEEILGPEGGGDEEFSGDELDDEFDFGDELDALDGGEEMLQAVEETPLDDLFGDEDAVPPVRDISEDETISTSTVVPEDPSGAMTQKVQPGFMAKFAHIDRKKAAIGAIVLLFLVGGIGLIMNSMGGSESDLAIVLPDHQEGGVGKGQLETVNKPPEAKNAEFSFAADASEVKIKLEATDPEGGKIVYEISSLPEYGRLSGEPPLLTYHADSKFAGKDKFQFRANDGTQASQPVDITISGPDIAARLAGPIVIEPKRPVIKAQNQEVAALSTEPFIIDWREIWNRYNEGSMKNVSVEVSAKGLKGKLARLDKYRHKYTPDPFSEGMEEFLFRFKNRGVASKLRKMEMKVASGNPKPDLIVAKLDKESYAIGDTVVIDASMTRDDKRQSVIFDCQQVSGVPVYFNHLNEEGSKVSFIMPSSFYTTDYPEPLIKMTAVDETGKMTSRNIRIKLQEDSFRQAALWDGLQSGRMPDLECPTGNCPGSRLP